MQLEKGVNLETDKVVERGERKDCLNPVYHAGDVKIAWLKTNVDRASF